MPLTKEQKKIKAIYNWWHKLDKKSRDKYFKKYYPKLNSVTRSELEKLWIKIKEERDSKKRN